MFKGCTDRLQLVNTISAYADNLSSRFIGFNRYSQMTSRLRDFKVIHTPHSTNGFISTTDKSTIATMSYRRNRMHTSIRSFKIYSYTSTIRYKDRGNCTLTIQNRDGLVPEEEDCEYEE